MTKAEEILSKYDSYYIAENTEKERVVISYESALEAVTKALRIHDVVGRSEQLVCPDCAEGRDPFDPEWKCPECRRRDEAN